eukprot:TRINITY_DN7145_c0_g1_i3.p1 TRINITY_DN7145_c0_g1~~TRINITY_DN7145_c0_g1_i3.p1  ORF type:complete len:102 (-),score=21.19 TRINITY_DN7145_c0_g1_i3:185-490(-)
MQRGLVGSEMCIRDRYQRRVHGLAGGSVSNEVRLFDLSDAKSTPTLLATMRYMPKACYTVDFSNQGDMCAISGGDGLIRVVDIFKPEQFITLSQNLSLIHI